MKFLLICSGRTPSYRSFSYKNSKHYFMISTNTRIRIRTILNRLESQEEVSLEERIFLYKLSSVSSVVSGWVSSALGSEASSIDSD